jgi:hypothetical protein
MKQIPALLFFVLFTMAFQNIFAQTKTDHTVEKAARKLISDQDPEFGGKNITYDEKTQIVTVTGNVYFKTKRLELADAGKIIFDKKANKFLFYDFKGFVADGVVVKDKLSTGRILEYTLGDDKVYIL